MLYLYLLAFGATYWVIERFAGLEGVAGAAFLIASLAFINTLLIRENY